MNRVPVTRKSELDTARRRSRLRYNQATICVYATAIAMKTGMLRLHCLHRL